jgi:hypothetical protein
LPTGDQDPVSPLQGQNITTVISDASGEESEEEPEADSLPGMLTIILERGDNLDDDRIREATRRLGACSSLCGCNMRNLLVRLDLATELDNFPNIESLTGRLSERCSMPQFETKLRTIGNEDMAVLQDVIFKVEAFRENWC